METPKTIREVITENQDEVLNAFISKLTTDNKDLDSEIVEMVNRKFKDLLLKL